MYAVQALLAAECLASAYNTVSGWQWQMVKCGLQFRDKVRSVSLKADRTAQSTVVQSPVLHDRKQSTCVPSSVVRTWLIKEWFYYSEI